MLYKCTLSDSHKENYCYITLPSDEPTTNSVSSSDFVKAYASDFLILGLLRHGYHDAVGHGKRSQF